MAIMMGRVSDAGQLFHAHALTEAGEDDEGMLLTTVFDALGKYQSTAGLCLERGFRLAGACSETLAKAAKYYRETDNDVAATVAATLPRPVQPPRSLPM